MAPMPRLALWLWLGLVSQYDRGGEHAVGQQLPYNQIIISTVLFDPHAMDIAMPPTAMACGREGYCGCCSLHVNVYNLYSFVCDRLLILRLIALAVVDS